jgi:hypothetical protein
MDTQIIPSPSSGRIMLLITPDSTMGALFEMVARLALQEPLYVLDGGNSFQGYPLARNLRQHTADIAAVMQRVLLSRAFTCYQMAALCTEETFGPHPILVLDFLATFYDQGVRAAERRRLLKICLRRLDQLSRRAPVVIWVRQRAAIPEEAVGFLDIVQAAAGQIWRPDRPALAVEEKPALLPGL